MTLTRTVRSRTALLLAVGITAHAIAPLLVLAPANAQLFPSQPRSTPAAPRTVTIAAGARIPTRYTDAEKVVVTPDETAPLTVMIDQNIRSSNGQLLIPSGTQVTGEVRPAADGSQFVAQELLFADGRRSTIDAVGPVSTERETIRKGADTGSILTGAAIGTAAAALLFALVGNRKIEIIEILGGAGLGAAGGVLLGRKKVDVMILRPDRDLSSITLQTPLELPQ